VKVGRCQAAQSKEIVQFPLQAGCQFKAKQCSLQAMSTLMLHQKGFLQAQALSDAEKHEASRVNCIKNEDLAVSAPLLL
jgi:hypothetical protein